MFFLILSMIFTFTTSTDFVNKLTEPVFAPSKTPVKVTRTHFDADGNELFKEYIYKEDNKIRIDHKLGEKTETVFVYNGKTGYRDGIEIPHIQSAEMVLYGCTCGYLETIDNITNESNELVAEGRQGNRLYIAYDTDLPIKYQFRSKTVEFTDYRNVDGFGKMPFLIKISGKKGLAETIKITDIESPVVLPINFFSVPKLSKKMIKTLN